MRNIAILLAILLASAFAVTLNITVKLTHGDQVFVGVIYLVVVIVLLASIRKS